MINWDGETAHLPGSVIGWSEERKHPSHMHKSVTGLDDRGCNRIKSSRVTDMASEVLDLNDQELLLILKQVGRCE